MMPDSSTNNQRVGLYLDRNTWKKHERRKHLKIPGFRISDSVVGIGNNNTVVEGYEGGQEIDEYECKLSPQCSFTFVPLFVCIVARLHKIRLYVAGDVTLLDKDLELVASGCESDNAVGGKHIYYLTCYSGGVYLIFLCEIGRAHV